MLPCCANVRARFLGNCTADLERCPTGRGILTGRRQASFVVGSAGEAGRAVGAEEKKRWWERSRKTGGGSGGEKQVAGSDAGGLRGAM